MILYKYRSLTNFEHVLDIILNQRLHCATYDELNDPFEGVFEGIIPPTLRRYPKTVCGLGLRKLLKYYKEVKVEDKICSLSACISDVRLWSYYADGHKGVALEIDFSGLEPNILHEVKYVEQLPSFPYSPVPTVLGEVEPSPQDVLSYKSWHWEYEKEYRIIWKDEYFPISNRLRKIHLGTRISAAHKDLLEKVVQDEALICETKINFQKIEVEIKEGTEK